MNLLFLTAFLGWIAPDTCQPLRLDPAGSILYWPSPPASPGNTMGWGSWGYQAGHRGSDYYAFDWSRNNAGVCDSPFLAPLGGRAVIVNNQCPTHCTASPIQCGAYGNQVVIESNTAAGFYFRVAHLSSVAVQQNDLIEPGQLIGYVGSTGNSTGPHAHCVLYKNTDAFLNGIATSLPGPDDHAVPFTFGANCHIVTALPASPTVLEVTLAPNPAQVSIRISPSASLGSYRWRIYDLQGRLLLQGTGRQATTIDVGNLPSATYIVEIQARRGMIRRKLVKS